MLFFGINFSHFREKLKFSFLVSRKSNMVDDGKKGSSSGDSFVKPGNLKQSADLHQLQTMETEGRGFPDFYRNSSEELFLKSLMESSIGMPVPTMEMLGFKNLSQTFRTDSEELFRSWLTNGENNGQNSSSIAHRTRQASRRISSELASFSSQQNGNVLQKKESTDVLLAQNNAIVEEISADFSQNSIRTAVERGLQASNLYLAKAWFHSSQPMTRSRSSELRRRYAAMQTAQTALGMDTVLNTSGNGASKLKEEFSDPNGFNDFPNCEIPNQLGTFMSPSNSSSSTFYNPQTSNVDKVSSVVSMLKGTLERKKLGNQNEREAVDDSCNVLSHAQEVLVNGSFNQGQGIFSEVSPGQVKDTEVLQTVLQGSVELDFEGFVNPTNTIQVRTVSREASQSESSAAAPVVSSGFDVCDGPSNSSQTLSFCETSKKQFGNGGSSESGSKAKDFRERIIDNLKDDRKTRGLVRYGSVTSADSVDRADPTKKRRVERSRKMAEAKERNLTPVIPSDMQAVLKRCENLEKEVRSLKLNLSFMNRKDSEQTKQIEELQKKNEDLSEEKERLLEEIERILAESGKM